MSAQPSDDRNQGDSTKKKIPTTKGAPTNVQIGVPSLFGQNKKREGTSIQETGHAPELPNQPDQTGLTKITATLPNWTPDGMRTKEVGQNWQEGMGGLIKIEEAIPFSAHRPYRPWADRPDDGRTENYAFRRTGSVPRKPARIPPKVYAPDEESDGHTFTPPQQPPVVPKEYTDPSPDETQPYLPEQAAQFVPPEGMDDQTDDHQEKASLILDMHTNIAGPTSNVGRKAAVFGGILGGGLLTFAASSDANAATTTTLHLIHALFA